MKFFIITLLAIIPLVCNSSITIVKIGGLFFSDETDLVFAFERAINDTNELYPDVQLVSVKRFLGEDNTIILQRITCELIENEVSAIFGPSSRASSDIVEILCDKTGIPHLQFDWHAEEMLSQNNNHRMTVNVAPNELMLAEAYRDILSNRKVFNWRSFTIVYESEESLARMQELLAWKEISKTGIKLVKFNRGDDYRIIWKDLKHSRERWVLLDCPPDILTDVMKPSIYYNMTEQFNNLLLTNLDTHTSNLKSLKTDNFTVIITAIRLAVNTQPADQIDVFEEEEEDKITSIHTMLLYDAVILFFRAIHKVIKQDDVYLPPQISCTSGEFWGTGPIVWHLMKDLTPKKSRPPYKTQRLQLNNFGLRDGFNLEIYNPVTDNIQYFWHNNNRSLIPFDELKGNQEVQETVITKYIVATRFGEPYFRKKPEPEGTINHFEGNERYEGFVVDLMYQLHQLMGFEYEFVPVADNKYGNPDPKTGEWDGIIRDLIDTKAHLGICDLTITQARREVVDFTVPFMQLGVGILHYRKKAETQSIFAFFDPYTLDVWVFIIYMIIITAIFMIIIARCSQNAWEPAKLNKDNVLEQENIWNLANVLWLVIGSNLQAGCDLLPRGLSMRFLTATLWIFAMVVTQTYTGNLCAAINASKMRSSVNSLHDLVNSKIKFGTVRGGATYSFLKGSNESDYAKASSKMDGLRPEAFTDTNEMGVTRVKHDKGDYAFLMETSSLKYYTERDCDLKEIGEHFGVKHYGIAMPVGALYRSNLSYGILKLSEKGDLLKIKKRWILNDTQNCDDSLYQSNSESDVIIMETIGGLFMILAAGFVLSLLIGAFEFLWNVNRIAIEGQIPFMCALKPELKFFFKFWLKRKPLHTYEASKRSSTKSTNYSSIDKTKETTNVKRKKTSLKNSMSATTRKCC